MQAFGSFAGSKLTSGISDIHIGHSGAPAEARTIRIGKQGVQLKTFVAGIRGATVSGATVMVSSSGQLGIQSSSRRYKEDIRAMGEASAAVLKLKPVGFRYRAADEQGREPVQFGLIAEGVAEVLPELVVYDAAGRPETVAFQALSTLLLSEFQKAHDELTTVARHAETQVAELAQLRTQAASREQELAALRAELAQLQQVTQLLAALPPAANVAQAAP